MYKGESVEPGRPPIMVALLAVYLLLVASSGSAQFAPPILPQVSSAASDVINPFVCYMSFDDYGGYRLVSVQQVCNGVNECPEGEDEVGCGDVGLMYAASEDQIQQIGFPTTSQGDLPVAASPLATATVASKMVMGEMLTPPSGFVRLPDKLQQKEYFKGVPGMKRHFP